MTQKIFTETQRFNKPGVDFVLVAILIVFGYMYVQQEILNVPLSAEPASPSGLLGGFSITLGVFLLLKSLRFKTRIDGEGIHYQLLPFHFKMKTIPWQFVESASLRTYDAIKEYGGYGFRIGFSGKGKAYIFGGQIGLQIVYEGRKLLVGTQSPQALEEALKRYKTSKN